jgi:hypothetical protein
MLTRNHKRYYNSANSETQNETSMGKCGQLQAKSVDKLLITSRSADWQLAEAERERGGWCFIGVHCHRNGIWMTFTNIKKG